MFLAHFVRLLLTSFGGRHSLRSFLGLTSFANSHFVRDLVCLLAHFVRLTLTSFEGTIPHFVRNRGLTSFGKYKQGVFKKRRNACVHDVCVYV